MKRIFIGLLFLFPLTIYAQGEWQNGVTDEGDMYFAASVNESNNLIGEFCSIATGSCIWLLGISTACKEGDQYPVLANSDSGSAQLQIYCSAKLDNGLFRYVFTDFDAINNIITKALRVGFAMPLQADQFRVVRFDLTGSNRALSSMLSATEKAQKKAKTKLSNTKDIDL